MTLRPVWSEDGHLAKFSSTSLAPLIDAASIVAQHAAEAGVVASQLRKEDDAADGEGNDYWKVDSSWQQFSFFISPDPGLRLNRPHVSTSVLIHRLSNAGLTVHETHVGLGHLEIGFLLGLLLSFSSGLWQGPQCLASP